MVEIRSLFKKWKWWLMGEEVEVIISFPSSTLQIFDLPAYMRITLSKHQNKNRTTAGCSLYSTTEIFTHSCPLPCILSNMQVLVLIIIYGFMWSLVQTDIMKLERVSWDEGKEALRKGMWRVIEYMCQQSWKGRTWRKHGTIRALGRDGEEDWTVESAKHFENAKRKSLCMQINGIMS